MERRLPLRLRAGLALHEKEEVRSAWHAYSVGLLRQVLSRQNSILPASEVGYLVSTDSRLIFLAPLDPTGQTYRPFQDLAVEDLQTIEVSGLTRSTLLLATRNGSTARYTALRDLDTALHRGSKVRVEDVRALLVENIKLRLSVLGSRPDGDDLFPSAVCPHCGAGIRSPPSGGWTRCTRCGNAFTLPSRALSAPAKTRKVA